MQALMAEHVVHIMAAVVLRQPYHEGVFRSPARANAAGPFPSFVSGVSVVAIREASVMMRTAVKPLELRGLPRMHRHKVLNVHLPQGVDGKQRAKELLFRPTAAMEYSWNTPTVSAQPLKKASNMACWEHHSKASQAPQRPEGQRFC